MRKNLIGLLAATAIAAGAGAAPAQAISGRPECEYDADYGEPHVDVTLAAVIPLTAGTDPARYPVSANVTCSIVVDGVTDVSFTTAATGVAVVAGQGQFRYSPNGFKVCTTIDYTSNANDTDHWCRTIEWVELIGYLSDLVWGATAIPDPVLCPVLQDLSPQTSPGDDVYITPEGDVYVLGWMEWDCPPYQPPA
ncbi:MAG TPA: hypothetical protein VNA20_08620 [Frankiaceae bacterium]|nr:hypothetical protein [Frankiaceae bacterium]